jgi:hypothetical protein
MHLCHDSGYRGHPFRALYRPFAALPGRMSNNLGLKFIRAATAAGGAFD